MQFAALERLENRYLRASTQLDAAFGSAGYVQLGLAGNSRLDDVLVQPDGKIVTVGRATEVDGTDTDAILVRFNPDGTLDHSFAGSGIKRLDLDAGSREAFTAATLGPDGTIIA